MSKVKTVLYVSAVWTILLSAIAIYSLFFADFGGPERPTCKAGDVAAIFTDCEVIQ